MAYSKSFPLRSGITAYSGGGNANAVLVSMGSINIISTCAASGDSVRLSSTMIGQRTTITNKGNYDAYVYPPPGGTIDSLAGNAAYKLAKNSTQIFLSTSLTAFSTLRKGERTVIRVFESYDIADNTGINGNTHVYHPLNVSAYGVPSSSFDKHFYIVVHYGHSQYCSLGIAADDNSAGTNASIEDKVYVSYRWSADIWHTIPVNSTGNVHYRFSASPDNGCRIAVGGWSSEGS